MDTQIDRQTDGQIERDRHVYTQKGKYKDRNALIVSKVDIQSQKKADRERKRQIHIHKSSVRCRRTAAVYSNSVSSSLGWKFTAKMKRRYIPRSLYPECGLFFSLVNFYYLLLC